jgi:hypothetical protein
MYIDKTTNHFVRRRTHRKCSAEPVFALKNPQMSFSRWRCRPVVPPRVYGQFWIALSSAGIIKFSDKKDVGNDKLPQLGQNRSRK